MRGHNYYSPKSRQNSLTSAQSTAVSAGDVFAEASQSKRNKKRRRNRQRRNRKYRSDSISSARRGSVISTSQAADIGGGQRSRLGSMSSNYPVLSRSESRHRSKSTSINHHQQQQYLNLRPFPANQRTDKLSEEIWNFFLSNKQSQELFARKSRLRQVLYKILRSHFADYDVELHIVGSTINGLANNESDVDMCIIMSPAAVVKHKKEAQGAERRDDEEEGGGKRNGEGEEGAEEAQDDQEEFKDEENNKVEPIDPMSILANVKEVLTIYNFVSDPRIITAKVPILKFIDRISGIEVTLNVNKSVSIRNSQLVYDYTQLDWRVQPLVMVIKAWANDHGINDAYNKSISSYSLVLMVIHYLQYSCKPPLLPCLQKLLPARYDVTAGIKKLTLDDQIAEQVRKLQPTKMNPASLKDLLIGFLNYYSYTFSYSDSVVSVRLGRTIAKHAAQSYKSKQNAFGQWKYLCIEEPFDRSNTARSVYDENTFNRILSVFRCSHYTLRRNPYLAAIMKVD